MLESPSLATPRVAQLGIRTFFLEVPPEEKFIWGRNVDKFGSPPSFLIFPSTVKCFESRTRQEITVTIQSPCRNSNDHPEPTRK